MVFTLTIKDNAFCTQRDKIYSLNQRNIKIKKNRTTICNSVFYI